MTTLTQILADVLEIRGVLAAAVVTVDGEILAGGAADTGLLDRITGAVTGALAAGEALSDLVTDSESSGKQMMVIYEDSGPIVFTPLPGGERVAVMALSSTHDLGRARFQLRGLTQALSTAEWLG